MVAFPIIDLSQWASGVGARHSIFPPVIGRDFRSWLTRQYRLSANLRADLEACRAALRP
jgi:hypothetical protein